jgi:hypothetical protein
MVERMKFWQLSSVCRSQPELIDTVVRPETRWRKWAEDFARVDELVQAQDRSILDAELPDELVRLVLSKLLICFYLSSDGWLRSWAFDPLAKPISALEAFVAYGGEAIEDALEKGSCRVS